MTTVPRPARTLPAGGAAAGAARTASALELAALGHFRQGRRIQCRAMARFGRLLRRTLFKPTGLVLLT
jgi:hypothetical protein